MPHPVLSSLADWADAVAALPAGGPLPVRTVLVPSERHAHALRRALLRTGRGAALAGTRFVGPATLALEIVEASGRGVRRGEEALRAARLVHVLSTVPRLEYFDFSLVRGTPGWPEAFAAAIDDLEGAGLQPEALPSTTPQARDLALLWRLTNDAAGEGATSARVLSLAAELLESGAPTPQPLGATLAAASGRESACQLRFLRALAARGATIALFAARPARDRHLERVAALLGPAAREALAGAPLPPTGDSPTERDLLVRHLFAPPALLADPDRPRSRGPDGTVDLSEHAGVEAEVAAAVDWVAREVLERRTPLDEVALLVPVADPYVSLLASRLSRLPWHGGPLPVHVAGGLPLTGTAGGARALALLRALAGSLAAESLADLLPALRADFPSEGETGATRTHLDHGEAAELAWSLGTLGGNAARPEGALEWATALAARQGRLEQEVAALDADPTADARDGRAVRRLLAAVRAARPPVEGLVALAGLVVEGAPLSALAPALVAFVERWLLDPGPGARVHQLLGESLEGAHADALGDALRGFDAIAFIDDRLRARRVGTCRFGEPAVYVGTLQGALGLDFDAVRVLALSEGSLPSPGREDPVLPDQPRAEAGPWVPRSEDRALGQLHAFDRAIRSARRSVALSVPRSDLERSEREAASILVDAAAAIGRPGPGGEPAPVIPKLASLAVIAFEPARAVAATFRDAHPLGEPVWQERAARLAELHPAWREGACTDLGRIGALREPDALGPADGVIGIEGPFPPVPGVSPGRTISASALAELLGCPLRFLYDRVLRWEEPAGRPSLTELDPLSYGRLFHQVMELFYQSHGEELVAARGGRARTGVAHLKKLAREVADRELTAFLQSYPLAGRALRDREWQRLLADVERFIDYDLTLPITRFVAVERPFGLPEPLVLETTAGIPLQVLGYVDRIDVEGAHTLVRDLKTGRDYPRRGDEEGPTLRRDVQIGLYGLVARKLAKEWGTPAKVQVAYAYARNGRERAFRADYRTLQKATKEWLGVAAQLLEAREFPSTPDDQDCKYCAFRPICGGDVPERAAGLLFAAEGAAGAYGRLRLGGGGEADGEDG